MGSLLVRASKSPWFLVAGTLASLIGLPLSVVRGTGLTWAILLVSLTSFFLLLALVVTNSKLLARMDSIRMNVHKSSSILLEQEDAESDYISSSDFTIVISTEITPETLYEQPTAILSLEYPSQLSFVPDHHHEVKREYRHSNGMRLRIPIKASGITVISLRQLRVSKSQEKEYLMTNKRMVVTLEVPNLKALEKHWEVDVDLGPAV